MIKQIRMSQSRYDNEERQAANQQSSMNILFPSVATLWRMTSVSLCSFSLGEMISWDLHICVALAGLRVTVPSS